MNLTEKSLVYLQEHIITGQRTTERSFLEIRDISFLRHTLFAMVSEDPNTLEQPSFLIVQAAKFAEEKLKDTFHTKGSHDGEKVHNVIHAYRVAIRLAEAGITDDIAIATALLHDVIEKTSVTKEDIAKKFGNEVAQNVSLLSINSNQGKKIPVSEYLAGIASASLVVKQVKVADRIDNLFSYLIMPLDAPMKHHKTVRGRLTEDLLETRVKFGYIDPKSFYLDAMLQRAIHRGLRTLEDDRAGRMVVSSRRGHRLAG